MCFPQGTEMNKGMLGFATSAQLYNSAEKLIGGQSFYLFLMCSKWNLHPPALKAFYCYFSVRSCSIFCLGFASPSPSKSFCRRAMPRQGIRRLRRVHFQSFQHVVSGTATLPFFQSTEPIFSKSIESPPWRGGRRPGWVPPHRCFITLTAMASSIWHMSCFWECRPLNIWYTDKQVKKTLQLSLEYWYN